MPSPRRLIVAVTGASGAVYGVRLLQVLAADPDVETHLVISAAGRVTLRQETDLAPERLYEWADTVHRDRDVGAAIASGSFRTEGMIVAPCSVKTLSAVATCQSGNLVARAADVTLKERRRLVLLFRETPLHAGHIRLMADATAAGAVVFPPVPAFYHRPRTLEDVVDQTVARVLDLFDIETHLFPRWEGLDRPHDVLRPHTEGVS